MATSSASTKFPDNYFFIKNQSNNLVLTVFDDSLKSGEVIVLESLKTKGYDCQLWTYKDGQLVNKKSGLSLGVGKGTTTQFS